MRNCLISFVHDIDKNNNGQDNNRNDDIEHWSLVLRYLNLISH